MGRERLAWERERGAGGGEGASPPRFALSVSTGAAAEEQMGLAGGRRRAGGGGAPQRRAVRAAAQVC